MILKASVRRYYHCMMPGEKLFLAAMRVVLILLLMVQGSLTSAQDVKPWRLAGIYGSAAYGGEWLRQKTTDEFPLVGGGITAFFQNGFGLSFQARRLDYDALDLPGDYLHATGEFLEYAEQP